ncbi:MAG: F0F1 ATP synthase subunit B [Lachnospiraceae bacterium]|nr:F0F1 ATP synthase subunit B [Lachnospiraceae bacterium]
MEGYIFGLTPQLLLDALILLLAVGFMFVLLSYLLFNPARDMLNKRREKIAKEMEEAAQERDDAAQFKAEYDAKLKAADKEVEAILSEGRKKALKREDEIVNEAKTEAARIMERASREIELEKNKMKDEVKREMVAVATVMAGKFVASSLNEEKQAQLIDEALNEMGDDTWRS